VKDVGRGLGTGISLSQVAIASRVWNLSGQGKEIGACLKGSVSG
jgi:hypothetical protein